VRQQKKLGLSERTLRYKNFTVFVTGRCLFPRKIWQEVWHKITDAQVSNTKREESYDKCYWIPISCSHKMRAMQTQANQPCLQKQNLSSGRVGTCRLEWKMQFDKVNETQQKRPASLKPSFELGDPNVKFNRCDDCFTKNPASLSNASGAGSELSW